MAALGSPRRRWIAALIAQRDAAGGRLPLVRQACRESCVGPTLTGRAFFAMPIPLRSDGGRVFDAIEIAPVVEFDEHGSCEPFESLDDVPAHLRDSVFWSIYGHTAGEGVQCIGDFESSQAALEVLQRLFGDLKPLPKGPIEL